MTPNQYFGKSKGSFPKKGVVGKESEWIDAGVISVPNGKLWVGDLQAMDQSDGHVVTVPKGRYRVEVKGMDFEGHRRTARVRAYAVDSAEPNLGKRSAQIGTDCGMIGLYDAEAFKKIVGKKHLDQYGQDVMQASMDDILGCVVRKYDRKTFEFAFLPSALGDGTFNVYDLSSGDKTVGLEVELLPPGYSVSFRST